MEEWLPSLAPVLDSHHLFQIPGPSSLPTCAWNPLPSSVSLDSDLFREYDILLAEILPLGGTLLCWWLLPFPGSDCQVDEEAHGEGTEGKRVELSALQLSLCVQGCP